nr:caspase family protein [Chitinophagaceae bacterium]
LEGPILWDAITGKRLAAFDWKYTDGINYAFFSPDNKSIITASYEHIGGQWDIETGKQIKTFEIPREQFNVVHLNKDINRLYTATGSGIIKIWNTSTGEVIHEIQTVKDKLLTSLSVNEEEDKLIAGSLDGSSYLITIPDEKIRKTLRGYTNVVGSVTFSEDGSKILVVNDLETYKVLDAEHFRINTKVSVKGNELNRADLLPNGNKLFVTSGDSMFFMDASNGKFLHSIDKKYLGQNPPAFSGKGELLFITGMDSVIRIWETKTASLILEISDSINPITSLNISSDGKSLMSVHIDGSIKMYDPNNGEVIVSLTDKLNENYYVQLSPDGEKIMAFADKKAIVWDAKDGNKIFETTSNEDFLYNGAIISPDGKWFLKESAHNKILAYKFGTKDPIFIIDGKDNNFIRIEYDPDGNQIITATRRLVQIWNAQTGKLRYEIPMGINFEFADINLKTQKILSFRNSEFKLLDFPAGRELISFYLIEDKDWVIVHPSGLFDATPEAMGKMYWVKENEIIELNQLKDRFYQPGLWNMVLENKALRSVAGMGEVKLYPEVITGEIKDGILPIDLKKRDGGYGKISIYVNNIEVIEDARPSGFDTSLQQQKLFVNIASFLAEGIDNHISVKAQSADGFISSRGITVVKPALDSSKRRNPALYAIICGTNEYSDPRINLRYPVRDAEAMAKAISLSGGNLFGTDSTHLFIITNPGKTPTTKVNIKNTFEEVSKRAKPEDIIMVYLSGHGITLGGDNDDFFYLTKEASGSRASSFRDPVLREKQTISTTEFTQMLNGIDALKRIMIIDACGSGKAVDNMLAMRNIDALQIRAIDRMKDRTGLYIISGCTADAESYESNIYGQGLLTYSILEGMKGPALKDYKMVDVLNVLQYARERVPLLASGLGGIQEPQMLIPTTGSFDIGIVNESDKKNIPLAEVKPVFVRPVLLELSKTRDVLKLSQEVKQKMIELTIEKGPKSEFTFLDVDEFPGACSISGIYSMENDKISLNGSLQFDGRDLPLKLEKIERADFAAVLINMVLKKIE